MPAHRKQDIPIGEGALIEFIDLTGRLDQAQDIDPLLAPIMPFLRRLEVHRQADCCGLNAFDFTPQPVAAAAQHFDRAELQRGLSAAIKAIDELPATVVVSRPMNTFIDRTTALQLLRHLLNRVAARAG